MLEVLESLEKWDGTSVLLSSPPASRAILSPPLPAFSGAPPTS